MEGERARNSVKASWSRPRLLAASMNCFNTASSTATRPALASGAEEGPGGAEGGGLAGDAGSGDRGVCGRKDLLLGGAERTFCRETPVSRCRSDCCCER